MMQPVAHWPLTGRSLAANRLLPEQLDVIGSALGRAVIIDALADSRVNSSRSSGDKPRHGAEMDATGDPLPRVEHKRQPTGLVALPRRPPCSLSFRYLWALWW
jgi:hypothetical protein